MLHPMRLYLCAKSQKLELARGFRQRKDGLGPTYLAATSAAAENE